MRLDHDPSQPTERHQVACRGAAPEHLGTRGRRSRMRLRLWALQCRGFWPSPSSNEVLVHPNFILRAAVVKISRRDKELDVELNLKVGLRGGEARYPVRLITESSHVRIVPAQPVSEHHAFFAYCSENSARADRDQDAVPPIGLRSGRAVKCGACAKPVLTELGSILVMRWVTPYKAKVHPGSRHKIVTLRQAGAPIQSPSKESAAPGLSLSEIQRCVCSHRPRWA